MTIETGPSYFGYGANNEPDGGLGFMVGRSVASVLVGDGEHNLCFVMTDGEAITLVAQGDCCSESWFADFNGVDSLRGSVIESVERVEMGDVTDARSRQDVDRAYGVKFTTSAGYADLVMRNSSNGYYGGEWSVTRSRQIPEGMTEIDGDWRA